MKRLKVECIDGFRYENVYTIRELSLMRHNLECKESTKRGIKYLEIPCTFDIETTNIYEKDADGNINTDKRPFAFMYQWQFCINDEVCFGRTWEEFQELLDNLTTRMDLDNKRRIVIWCHNLNFEFQFFRRFVNVIDGFYKEDRVPLKVVIEGGIEFRDSYILSNMSLEKFCENEPGVIHYKLSGNDYDYTKIRTPETELTAYELQYCYNDVRGLAECIASRMKEDTLANMPMTSTGYVRRDARNAIRVNKKNRQIFTASALTPELYTMCRTAFRGGDTHANIRMADQILYDVDSYDIQSSYPACMMIDNFPVSAFFKIKTATFYNRDLTDYALLLHIRICDVKYVGACGIPYIPLAKCTAITSDRIIDNGRVLYAGIIEMIITDVDLDIITSEYDIGDFYINNVYASRYGALSPEYKSVIMRYFEGKTALKGVPGKEYEYMKSKNRLNALYGMMCQKIDHDTTIYNGHDFITTPCVLDEAVEKYYKSHNSFLSYQHGVWVTCAARRRLRTALNIVGRDVAYCDTDSVKCINGHEKDFEKLNEKLKAEAIRAGAYAEDKNGNIQYMGVWEHETKKEKYQEFKTLGSKKYVYRSGDHVTSTIAGVNKKTGSRFFKEYGLEVFKHGTRIKESGHLTAFYNDDDIHYIEIDGVKIETASNVALVDNTYTLGVTDEYMDLLEKALANEDNLYYI